MGIKTVGILSPGEMGHNIALVLSRHGLSIVTCLRGRSQHTQQLAETASITNLPDLQNVVMASDIIISVVIPSAALEIGYSIAKAIEATQRRVLIADANAISPMTSIKIGEIITASGGKYVDASIIGSAAKLEKGATFYASGEYAEEFAILNEFGLHVQILGRQPGQASALKMIYAGLSKGLSALSAELLITARSLGILEQVLERYRLSFPEIVRFMANNIPGLPFRAARRSEEMVELSATIENSELNPIMATASGKTLGAIGDLDLGSKYSEQDEFKWSLQDAIEILYRELKKPSL